MKNDNNDGKAAVGRRGFLRGVGIGALNFSGRLPFSQARRTECMSAAVTWPLVTTKIRSHISASGCRSPLIHLRTPEPETPPSLLAKSSGERS